jgi:hypothetical protein
MFKVMRGQCEALEAGYTPPQTGLILYWTWHVEYCRNASGNRDSVSFIHQRSQAFNSLPDLDHARSGRALGK